MSHVDFERRPPSDYDRRTVTPAPDRATPWWVAALVAIVAIVAVAVVLLGRGQSDQQAAFNQGAAQGAAQTATNDASQRAESAATQANTAANAANASAVQAQNQAALHSAQVENNPAQQPQVPAGVTSAAPPGVVTSGSAPPPQ